MLNKWPTGRKRSASRASPIARNFRPKTKSTSTNQYGDRTWSTVLWTQERTFLRQLLDRPSFVPSRSHYIDFACGTGRVTQFLSPYFTKTTGVDISHAMLSRAREMVPDGNFIQGDVCTTDLLPGSKADLITAFRFLLNAEAQDRLPALKWMRSQLRDGDSRVVINNHGNLMTHKIIPHLARKLRGKGNSSTGNLLSHRRTIRLVHEAGFRVEEVRGYGYVGAHLLGILEYEKVLYLQQRMETDGPLRRLAEDQVYVLAPN